MKKKLLIIVLLVIVMGIVLGFIYKKETDYKKTDAYKFKVEYESYNGAKNTAGDNFYRSIEINKNNKMVYSTAGEIVEKIEKKRIICSIFWFW